MKNEITVTFTYLLQLFNKAFENPSIYNIFFYFESYNMLTLFSQKMLKQFMCTFLNSSFIGKMLKHTINFKHY